ncbi:hypothetical protein [Helicobacter pylori]|uniref:Uncharacterized protein n=1 Tax=Helicobacter pylori Aklavik86 TaxID=1055532 RepID=K7Y398_HELPX|nr:hypothetical protein [Helicobacter pylori]AFX90189.1 hypothetical protein HPAKL86_06000 [Helicobacter pylori Aklavik86]WQS14108.1 hypothetical protein KVD76_06085 [Helicobacter pylori]WQS23847.1 hypothetical protein KVD61_06110 [Helicobacter pylori]
MKLFDKLNAVTEAYESFSEEAKLFGRSIVDFLKYFSETNDSFYDAVLKVLNSDSGGFSILVKGADGVDDYPLLFVFRSATNHNDTWEFIVKETQERNQTMHEFLKSIQHEDKDHSLTRQIARAGECRSFMKENARKAGVSDEAMLIVEYLIVELLKNGGFDD